MIDSILQVKQLRQKEVSHLYEVTELITSLALGSWILVFALHTIVPLRKLGNTPVRN